jgi:hypothetical protein
MDPAKSVVPPFRQRRMSASQYLNLLRRELFHMKHIGADYHQKRSIEQDPAL